MIEAYEKEIARLRLELAKIADAKKYIDTSDGSGAAVVVAGCAEIARKALEPPTF